MAAAVVAQHLLRWADVTNGALCFKRVADRKECLFAILGAMGDQQFTSPADCDEIVRMTISRR